MLTQRGPEGSSTATTPVQKATSINQTTSLRMAGGILHGGFNQHPRDPLGERAAGEVIGQREVETVCAVAIRLSV